MKFCLILRIFRINTSLKSLSRNWIRSSEFVKFKLNLTKAVGGSVCRSHLHPFNFKKQEERRGGLFLSKINQSVEVGHCGCCLQGSFESPQSTTLQSARLTEVEIFPLLIDSAGSTDHCTPAQPTVSSSNYRTTTTTAAAVMSYLDQIMSIRAELTIFCLST